LQNLFTSSHQWRDPFRVGIVRQSSTWKKQRLIGLLSLCAAWYIDCSKKMMMMMMSNNSAALFSLWVFTTGGATAAVAAFTPPLSLVRNKQLPKMHYGHDHSHVFMHSGGVEDSTMDFSPFSTAESSQDGGSNAALALALALALPLKLIQDFEASLSPSTVLFGSTATASSSSAWRPSPTALYSTTIGSASSTVSFNTACDDVNRPPSLNILLKSIQDLCPVASSNTDIRGRFVNHARLGSLASVAQAIGKTKGDGKIPSLTPIAAYCLGHALARNLHVWKSSRQRRQQLPSSSERDADDDDATTTINIMIGRDPRPHGTRLADAVARGAESYSNSNANVQVYYTGIATTPGCAALCLKSSSGSSSTSSKSDSTDDDYSRLSLSVDGGKNMIDLDASVMITASHLPEDRNGLKFFSKLLPECGGGGGGGFEQSHIQQLAASAMDCAVDCYNRATLPPSSGKGAVMCTGGHVNWMPAYAATLKRAIQRQIGSNSGSSSDKPLQGLSIVLNAGHGSGGFFEQVLQDLGADTTGSIGCTPIINDDDEDGDMMASGSSTTTSSFPNGVPNPEYPAMYTATVQACRDVRADLGIMLDTDADRCAFVVPSRSNGGDVSDGDYEPLNRNRLIALLGVVFAKEYPGSTVVTCSVTSEGVSNFLQDHLGLKHVRYLKGYANVIRKAKEITYSTETKDVAELAIETSGHCAMRENNYIDDGTYTAVKVVSLLAQQQQQQQQQSKSKSLLLDLISEMKELAVLDELRFPTLDASLNTMRDVFDFCALAIEQAAAMNKDDDSTNTWELDTENLEGIRVRFGKDRADGQFFMLRKSLHDPIISLQIEGTSRTSVQENIIQPLWQLFNQDEQIMANLDLSVLQKYK
jgi:phosphomannomutase